MAALPYIQLYIADYLADTMHLNAEEHGAYLLLIFNYWQTGKPIPKTRLQAIARVSNERWTDVERTLNEFFNDNGTAWQHDRIDEDLAKIEAKQSQAVLAGKASAAARKAKKQPNGNGRSTVVSTDDSTGVDDSLEQNANHTDTDTDTEENKPPSSKGAITLRKWLEKIKKANELAIPTDDTIFQWCDDAKIPHEFLTINWVEFKNRFEPSDKRQKDWRQHFRNSVRGNWFGLWYIADGGTQLTTKGIAAMRVLDAEQRRAS